MSQYRYHVSGFFAAFMKIKVLTIFGTSVVLLVPEIMHDGIPEVFLHQLKLEKSQYDLNSVSMT